MYITFCSHQVTKLDRDPASGTALQEISFWLNLERALMRIQEKRDSLEIALTLDILKHGKRFHATLSFDTDTGKLDLAFVEGISGSIKKLRVSGRYQGIMSWYLVFNISLHFYLNDSMIHLPKLEE